MTRTGIHKYAPLATLLLLFAAPFAAAEEPTPSDEPVPYGNESCIECSGPAPDSSEERPANEPIPYGNESCIECSGPAPDGSDTPTRGPADCEYCRGNTNETEGSPETCMDGASEGEECMEDVQYFGGGPADTGGQGPTTTGGSPPADVKKDDAASERATVPAPGIALAALGILGAAAIAISLRRK